MAAVAGLFDKCHTAPRVLHMCHQNISKIEVSFTNVFRKLLKSTVGLCNTYVPRSGTTKRARETKNPGLKLEAL